jgi:hypothetical protein
MTHLEMSAAHPKSKYYKDLGGTKEKAKKAKKKAKEEEEREEEQTKAQKMKDMMAAGLDKAKVADHTLALSPFFLHSPISFIPHVLRAPPSLSRALSHFLPLSLSALTRTWRTI